MPPKVSHCSACGRYFNSKKALREHIDREHRITDDSPRNRISSKPSAEYTE